MIAPVASSRRAIDRSENAQRHAPDHDRLRLRPDRVGHVDDRGHEEREQHLRSSSSSNEATIPADAIAPTSPIASHGSRCQSRRGTALLGRLRAAPDGEESADSRQVLLVLLGEDCDES